MRAMLFSLLLVLGGCASVPTAPDPQAQAKLKEYRKNLLEGFDREARRECITQADYFLAYLAGAGVDVAQRQEEVAAWLLHEDTDEGVGDECLSRKFSQQQCDEAVAQVRLDQHAYNNCWESHMLAAIAAHDAEIEQRAAEQAAAEAAGRAALGAALLGRSLNQSNPIRIQTNCFASGNFLNCY